jgi:OST-HTH/LOTUS domain-containing protein
MEKQDVEAIASKVVDLIQSTDARQITGVRLGVQIRGAFPSFSPSAYGCRNLREFIFKHVPRVRLVGQQTGPEIIYALAGEDTPQPARWKVRTQEWRTFVNPHPRYVLHANPQTYDVTTFPQKATVSPPWIRIESCSEAAHIDMAKEFLRTLSDVLREPMERTLQGYKWWFMFAVKARELGIYSQWSAFRHRELWKILLTELEQTENALAAPENVPPDTAIEVSVAKASPPEVSIPTDPNDELLRKVVLSVIGRMPIHQLRGLSLPVGDVMEAFQQK